MFLVCRGDSKNRLSSHFKRVVKYARPSDYAAGAASTIAGPGLLLLWERIAPSHVGKGGFAPVLRLTTAISAGAGFLLFYNRSIRKAGFFCLFNKKSYNLSKKKGTLCALLTFLSLPTLGKTVRFYGFEENKREVEMDMREMVDKVKRKEPLYGTSSLSPYIQGVASRNSRYSGVWLHVIPWFNFVNHEQVCAIIRFSYLLW